MLTKEQILSAQDIKTEAVDVPEWAGQVNVRVMSGAARDAFGASLRDAAGTLDMTKYRAGLLVRTIVDEAGVELFTLADLEALNGKSGIALQRVFEVADRLNAMSGNAVEEAAKN